ncbi:MAG: oligosaccharide flippase family protein [Bacteroidetes bacterium]|nr:oligosaccharide flippase family protein [Bacteroidota bacterium]
MIKNIIANFIGRFWSVLSNFLFIPLYIELLGFESYSLISFGLVIAGLMAVLDSGLTATLSRELARSDHSLTEKARTFKTLESLYFIIASLAILIVITFSNLIANDWITSDSYTPTEVALFIKILSFDIGFQLLIRFYLGGFIGLEQQVKSNLLQMSWGIARNGLVVLTLLITPSLKLFFIWQAASTVIFVILSGLLLRKEINGKYFSGIIKIENQVLKRIWKFAGGMLLISLVAALNTQMDKLAISKLLPIESLGYYTLAVSLSMGILIVVNPISIAILPRLTSYFTSNLLSEAEILFNKTHIIVTLLVFSLMTNIFNFSYELIWLWTGKNELALESHFLLKVISIGVSFLALQIIPFNIAIANGYTKLNNIMGIISLVLTLPGYWLMTAHYGAIGAAYVYCIVQVTITLLFIYFINKKFFANNNLKSIFLKPIILPLFITLIIGYLFSFIPDFIRLNRFYALIWIGFSIIMTFIVTTLMLIPRAEIRILSKQLKFIK